MADAQTPVLTDEQVRDGYRSYDDRVAVRSQGRWQVWRDAVSWALAAQAPAQQADSYEDIWNALQRIDSAAVFLPTFEVRHEGGIEAVTQNIVDAITALHPAPSHKAVMQQALDALKKVRWDSLNMARSDMFEIQAAIAAMSATMEKPNGN